MLLISMFPIQEHSMQQLPSSTTAATFQHQLFEASGLLLRIQSKLLSTNNDLAASAQENFETAAKALALIAGSMRLLSSVDTNYALHSLLVPYLFTLSSSSPPISPLVAAPLVAAPLVAAPLVAAPLVAAPLVTTAAPLVTTAPPLVTTAAPLLATAAPLAAAAPVPVVAAAAAHPKAVSWADLSDLPAVFPTAAPHEEKNKEQQQEQRPQVQKVSNDTKTPLVPPQANVLRTQRRGNAPNQWQHAYRCAKQCYERHKGHPCYSYRHQLCRYKNCKEKNCKFAHKESEIRSVCPQCTHLHTKAEPCPIGYKNLACEVCGKTHKTQSCTRCAFCAGPHSAARCSIRKCLLCGELFTNESSHILAECPSRVCGQCQRVGHTHRSCPQIAEVAKTNRALECGYCASKTHATFQCTKTSKMDCKICKQFGLKDLRHTIFQCPQLPYHHGSDPVKNIAATASAAAQIPV